jgi:hypothetical protein
MAIYAFFSDERQANVMPVLAMAEVISGSCKGARLYRAHEHLWQLYMPDGETIDLAYPGSDMLVRCLDVRAAQ